jgi:hypothetical protein
MFQKAALFLLGASIFFNWLPLAMGGADKPLADFIRTASHGWQKADGGVQLVGARR